MNQPVAGLDGRFLSLGPVPKPVLTSLTGCRQIITTCSEQAVALCLSVHMCVCVCANNLQVNMEAEERGGGSQKSRWVRCEQGCVCVCVYGARESSPHAGRPGSSGLDHMCSAQKKKQGP